jgi:hypothetical protein
MTEWYESDELRPPALAGVLREALKELHWPRPELDERSGVWLCEHEGAVIGFAVFRSIPNYAAGGAEDDW